MSTYLMIPIQVDALYVAKDNEKSVVDQVTDFDMLPYRTTTEDRNCDTANLSEAIVSEVFQNANLRLGPGIHLH